MAQNEHRHQSLPGVHPGPGSRLVPETGPARELVLRAESRIADVNQLKGDASTTLLRLLTRIEGLATSSVENIRSTMRSMSLLESLRGRRRPETDRDARLTLGSVHLNTAALHLAETSGPPDSLRHRGVASCPVHRHSRAIRRRQAVHRTGVGRRRAAHSRQCALCAAAAIAVEVGRSTRRRGSITGGISRPGAAWGSSPPHRRPGSPHQHPPRPRPPKHRYTTLQPTTPTVPPVDSGEKRGIGPWLRSCQRPF